MNLLNVKNLTVRIYDEAGYVEPLTDICFGLKSGESVGVVGESGCGKTMLALSIMKLLPKGCGKIVDGEVVFNGNNLVKFSEDEMREVRGREISLIFQEPMTSLDPVMKIGEQIGESIKAHFNFDKNIIHEKTINLLKKVGIQDPGARIKNYPYEMSGGMRQRAMIASALSCGPKLLIADEPTTALDVTIQSQILNLVSQLKNEFGMSLMLITHDFGVVSEMTENVMIMYAGQFVEQGKTCDVLRKPMHPYTNSLIKSLPQKNKEKLYTIPGRVPDLKDLPEGCRFADRCYKAKHECRTQKIDYVERDDRLIRCIYPEI